MNFFFLDADRELRVRYMCDQHLRKMTLEYLQILHTYLRKKYAVPGTMCMANGKMRETLCYYWEYNKETEVYNQRKGVYAATHINHPCVIACNPDFYIEELHMMFEEHEHRFGKKSDRLYHSFQMAQQIKAFHGDFGKNVTVIADCTPYAKEDTKFQELYWKNYPNLAVIIDNYRKFYNDKFEEWSTRTNKRRIIMEWTKRKVPDFILWGKL